MKTRIIRIFFVALLTCFLYAPSQALTQIQEIGPVNNSDHLLTNLQNIITYLQNYGERSSWEKQNQAIAWAKKYFETLGLLPWIETYEKDGRQWSNAFAQIQGKSHPNEIILVIAHIDSISDCKDQKAPGADDNATGVAALLELSRLLKDSNPDRSIRFALFSNEERKTLGSQAYARKARSENQNIRAVINLDILGYNPPKTTIQWKLFISDVSLKYKSKALMKIFYNEVTGVIQGSNTLIIAGRPNNSDLVKEVASSLRAVPGLTAKEIIKQDCG